LHAVRNDTTATGIAPTVNAIKNDAATIIDFIEFVQTLATRYSAPPYNIRYWEVGNELWGKWQNGWATAAGNADRYRQRIARAPEAPAAGGRARRSSATSAFASDGDGGAGAVGSGGDD
jgi:hypothetical protein